MKRNREDYPKTIQTMPEPYKTGIMSNISGVFSQLPISGLSEHISVNMRDWDKTKEGRSYWHGAIWKVLALYDIEN